MPIAHLLVLVLISREIMVIGFGIGRHLSTESSFIQMTG